MRVLRPQLHAGGGDTDKVLPAMLLQANGGAQAHSHHGGAGGKEAPGTGAEDVAGERDWAKDGPGGRVASRLVEGRRREERPGGGAEECMAPALTATALPIWESIRTFSRSARNAGTDSGTLLTRGRRNINPDTNEMSGK